MNEHSRLPIGTKIGKALLAASLLALAPLAAASAARADDAVSLSITLKDHKFDPTELHAPPGKQIVIHVKNLNTMVSEFESSALHFEKIVPAGSDVAVYVHPLHAGRYKFYDDFHRATQGYLVVP